MTGQANQNSNEQSLDIEEFSGAILTGLNSLTQAE
jgi:hypothetical protein